MSQAEYTFEDYLNIISRRKAQLILPMLVILSVCTALAFALPSIYRSEATILVEHQEIPTDLVRSTVTTFAGERVHIISQRVMTTENLGRIINDHGLYLDQRDQISMSLLVEKMRKEVGLEMVSADVIDPRSGRPSAATIAFKLAFNHESPQVAQSVTQELVSLYMNENQKERTKAAVETSGFLAAEAEKLKKQVNEHEMALAEFKERNINNLPELQQLNIQLMERTTRELQDTDQQIRALEERRIYLGSELAQINPNTDLFTTDGRRMLSAEDRLRTLRTEYLSMTARYASTHPDVIKMEREIRALEDEVGGGGNVGELRSRLESQRAEMATLMERYSESHPDVKKLQRAIASTEAELSRAEQSSRPERRPSKLVAKPDNPAYIQLQAQLSAANQELKSLRQVRSELKDKLADYENRLIQGPRVEQEYRNLTRDYDNAIAKYKEIKAKQLEADLAQSMERESKGERFLLIEPPNLPEIPVKPNRLAILFVGFVLSIGAGFGSVTIAEMMSSAIKDPKGLMAIAGGRPILVVVPYIEGAEDVARKRAWRVGVFMAMLLLITLSMAAVHYFVMPLEEAWPLLLRELGSAL